MFENRYFENSEKNPVENPFKKSYDRLPLYTYKSIGPVGLPVASILRDEQVRWQTSVLVPQHAVLLTHQSAVVRDVACGNM